MTPETQAAILDSFHKDLAAILEGHDPQPEGWDTPGLPPVTPTVSSDLMDAGLTREAVLTAVCSVTGLSKTEIRSQRRARYIARPRQVACFLMKELSLLSFPQIGHYLGGRDHTTVMHAVRVVREKLKQGDELTTTIWRDARLELGL